MWYIYRYGQQFGPISEAEFQSLSDRKQISPTDLVWREGFKDWLPAIQVPNGPVEPSSTLSQLEIPAAEPTGEPKDTRSWLRKYGLITVLLGGLAAIIVINEPNSFPYRLTGALNGAFFGAIGGALGALPEYFLHGRWRIRGVVVGTVIGILLAHAIEETSQSIGQGVYERTLRAQVDRADVSRMLLKSDIKIYGALKDNDPVTFDKIVDELAIRARRGDDQVTMINAMREKYIQPVLARSLKYLSDDATIQYAQTLIEELRVFQMRQPKLCVAALRGQSLGDLRPYYTPAMQAAEAALLETAIRSDKTRAQPMYPKAQYDKIITDVVAKMAPSDRDDLILLDPSADLNGKEQKSCAALTAFLSAILMLPKPVSGPILRTTFSGQ